MNKIIRISVPLIFAFLFISILIWLAGASSHAVANPSPPNVEGAILVTTLEDELNSDGDCSLREAITAANNNMDVDVCPAGDAVITDTIVFDVAGMIIVTEPLMVVPTGTISSLLVVDGGDVITVSGGGTTRVWDVYGSNLTLKHLAVINGYHNVIGGGLFNTDGKVSIISSSFNGNSADGYGGGIFNSSVLTITNSLFSNNHAGSGGSIRNAGALTIINSSFYNNNADLGGGIYNESPYFVTISKTLFSSNNATDGGGIYAHSSKLTVVNSTFSGNNAWRGGGIAILLPPVNTTNSNSPERNIELGDSVEFVNASSLTVTNTTFTNNSASYGGGIWSNGNVNLINTIVANSPSGLDCFGTIIDGGHNISSDTSCGFLPINDSLPNTNPLLGPLQDNAGPTFTHALLGSSPAIDAGDEAQCSFTDQRGVPRPQDGDGDGIAVCDIGSYEMGVAPRSVIILGPSNGYTYQANTFSAIVEPISTTLPLKYTWQATGLQPIIHTGGLTDTVSITWDKPGEQIITVTASLAGSVSDTHEVTISLYDLYLPLVLKSSEKPINYLPSFFLPGSGALVGLIFIGVVRKWKSRG